MGTLAGRRSHAAARARRLEFWRHRPRVLAAFLPTVAVFTLGLHALLHGHPYQQGLTEAAFVGASLAMAFVLADRASGSSQYAMGGLAAEWTSGILKELRRVGWRSLDELELPGRRGDVDHVLVGPGGVFAVETKWKSAPTKASLRLAAADARRHARDLGLLLISRGFRVRVQPVVVIHTPSSDGLQPLTMIEDVPVVVADLFTGWESLLGGPSAAPDGVIESLRAYRNGIGGVA